MGKVFLTACLLFSAAAFADGPGSTSGDRLLFTASKNTIQYGERTRIEFSLPISALGLAKYDDESELPVLNDDLVMENKHLIVLERDFRREKDTLIWRFDVTAYEKGKVIVPPVEIKFGPHTFSSESVPLDVVARRKENDKELRPDFGLAALPVDWAFWVALGGFTLVGILVFFYGRKKRWWIRLVSRWRRLSQKSSVAEEAPESWLRRELMRLRTRLRAPGEGIPPLVDDLTAVLRVFFRRKTSQPADSWTTGELQRKLPAGTLPEPLVPVLQRADRFKFQGVEMDGAHAAKEIVEPGIETSERAWL